ncbi:hypothetical protein [Catenovulum sediminis]|uniref:Uncharacterized protein n=1 Tax=Catenovulum sediminis TaxID=1740262 RepID=A0ABV1RIY6_9ALTE|nr:hypothetical protein [Catenovulum sediminis]
MHNYVMQKLYLLYPFALMLLLAGCERFYTLEKHRPEVFTEADFYQVEGYKLRYDLYMPNSYTGWHHSDRNKFELDEKTNTYWMKNVDISKPQVDDVGGRFKIASIDWQNQFGFGEYDVTQDESSFGLPEKGVVLHLHFSHNSRDMFIELPKEKHGKWLTVGLKVTSDSLRPNAIMMVKLTNIPFLP